jgi:hypothetical protein
MARCPLCGVEHSHFHIDSVNGLDKYVKWCPKHCLLCKLEEDEANDADNRGCGF